MTEGYAALSEKEKEALRLIVGGYDAKSSARRLGLSVHTINERLRDARRKLSVSSSREAARIVLAAEGPTPQFVMDKPMGEAKSAPDMRSGSNRAAQWRLAWIVGGVLIMSLILSLLALGPVAQNTQPPAATSPQVTAAAIAETEVVRSARAWLALVDQGRWNDSFDGTGPVFHAVNTSERWAELSKVVRAPLGQVISRTAISQARDSTPPHGYEVVKFRTSFSGRPQAVETVSLDRVVVSVMVYGYYFG
jgi:DNA-binding CsgD family transcriptional regulator